MEKIKADYTAHVQNTGGRNGHVKSSDGIIDLDVSMPKEIGGEGGAKTNPEQLFAAGYAACFGGALGAVANGRDVSDFSIDAYVSIGKSDKGGFALSAKLEVNLPNLDKETAQQVVKDAHEACPYSKATSGNIEVTVEAV